MRDNILKIIKALLDSKYYNDAVHAMEFYLLVFPNDTGIRLVLAKVYISLKENNYRSKARHHLEHLIDTTGGETLAEVVRLLIFRIYLTNGPVGKASDLIIKHSALLRHDEIEVINAKINEITTYLLSKPSGKRRSSLASEIFELENFESAVDRWILGEFRETLDSLPPSKDFFTFGSCFAGNVAREMKRLSMSVESFWVGEEVNTTFSNINLIRRILGENTLFDEYYDSLLVNLPIPELTERLIEADTVIYTLGIAPAFFSDDGTYIPHNPGNLKSLLKSNKVHYRFSTVSENIEKILELRDILRKKTKVTRVFLTVSPVPMAASLLSSSTAVDDMESKSILRCAAGEICRQHPEFFTYFPSFEVFRWLPCFRDESSFGKDDGSSRHVNTYMVNKVVSSFIEAAGKKVSQQ